MQKLDQIAQLLIENKSQQALEALRQWALSHQPERVMAIELQLSRFNLNAQNFTQGLKTMAEYQTELLQINNAILFLINECRQNTPTSRPQTLSALHEYHAYTCDRVEHNDTFKKVFGKGHRPTQFYFLYGGDLQSHEGLFRRIAYDLEGRLQDYLNPELKTNIQSLQLEMTFEYSGELENYKTNILRSFFSMLGLVANEHEPLLAKDLAYALARSPRLQQLTEHDYVCGYLHISQYDWDAELTPAAAKWFVTDFCGKALPDHLPTILFFFAIEYDEADEDIRREVQSALHKAEKVTPLPELGMVSLRDVGQWLERYKQLSPNARERKQLLKEVFGAQREHYMEDVELELKKIIDAYNNSIV
ncbi:MAG: hypothetical protein D6772_15380 [Bacteroidetes bacterium]|nr:MAG: hypothetical protein D6772_15380 [Bacteroidota bacterium]